MKAIGKDLSKIRSDLQNLVNAPYVKECPEDLKAKLAVPNHELLLVEPGSEEEVSAVLQYATEQQLSVIPAGYGQQLHIGEAPKSADILLSSRRLTGIVEHSVGDLTMTVKAGTLFSEVQAHLRQHGQFVPITPPTQGESTIGGLVATAASGPERVLYGSWRDNVIGLRVVYPNGQVIRTGGKVVKNVAGYDMNKLFVGSHGTLAFITEITLKLRPYPKYRELVLAECEAFAPLIRLASRILGSECVPSSLELMGRMEDGQGTYRLAIGSDDVKSAAKYQAERIGQMVSETESNIRLSSVVNEDTEAFWNDYRSKWKETAANSLVLRAGFLIPHMTKVLEIYEKESSSRKIQMEYAVSLGIGTLRVRLSSPDSDALKETAARFRHLAESHGGYLVVEHGEGTVKQDLGVWGVVRSGLSLMKGIKQTVDPAGILSPGRYAGGI
ncbi:glycolate oxidase FAD binding subunit [Effusibacillus lacus]|nr:glycolate oxidase FAD binding subunit [Effusibacillus lacus]